MESKHVLLRETRKTLFAFVARLPVAAATAFFVMRCAHCVALVIPIAAKPIERERYVFVVVVAYSTATAVCLLEHALSPTEAAVCAGVWH